MSPTENSYRCLSEPELATVFWKDKELQKVLRNYALPEFPTTANPSLAIWLSNKEPGHLITKLLTDIGGYDEEQRKKKRDYGRRTFKMSKQDMVAHITAIRHHDFMHIDYNTRGYVLRGSIRTDGFLL
ncbi:hypothetical protein BGZ65_005323, partial [Modicella reniformis]